MQFVNHTNTTCQPPQPRKYQEIGCVGDGAYGTVFKAREKTTGQIVAIKRLKIPLSEEGVPANALREIGVLQQFKQLNHPNLVRLLEVYQSRRSPTEARLQLVFELVDFDLNKYIDHFPPRCALPGTLIKNLVCQIVCGVNFLHEHRIIHRDIKPQNILVDQSGRVKIADFGLARFYSFNVALTDVVVTLYYRPPEVLLLNSYTTSADVWSCGCIFAELFRREPLFAGSSEIDQLYRILEVLGTPPVSEWPPSSPLVWGALPRVPPKPLSNYIPNLDPQAQQLLEHLLLFDPEKRLTCKEILSHAYFDDLFHRHPASTSAAPAAASTTPTSSLPETTSTLAPPPHSLAPSSSSSSSSSISCPSPHTINNN